MFSRFAIVLFATFLLVGNAGNLSAQGRGFRGGPRAAANMPAPASAPRSTFVFHPQGPVGAPIVRGPRFGGMRHQRTVVVADPFIGGYSPYFWGTSVYTPQAYAEPTYVTAPVNQNEVDLAYQVQRLSQEIEQLRQEQALAASRQSLSPPPPSVPGPPAIPTTLVFRDGRRMEIENYAVVGQTIWVLDEKTSLKISIADLDLDATQRENRSKGVRILLPQR